MIKESLPKIEDFIILSDKNNKYSVKIFSDSDSYLNIHIKTIDKIPIRNFEDKVSFDTIKKNKYFIICENISEVLISIKPSIQNKDNIKLLEEENELNLIIILPNPVCPEIIFKVKEKKRDLNEAINQLYEIYTKQAIQINKNNNLIEDLKLLINEQSNQIKYLENKCKKLEENNLKKLISEEIIKIKKKEKYSLKNSKIIEEDIEKEEIIKEWIDPNKNIKFSLLYRMSRDGENVIDFHKNCDNKGSTLTLAETTKGYKIGGYTTLNWESPNSYINKNDDLTFIFSLNQMKKYSKKNNNWSIYVDKNFGPCFGYAINLGFGEKEMNKGFSYNGTFLTNYELTNGDYNFTYKEIEVYKVDFE